MPPKIKRGDSLQNGKKSLPTSYLFFQKISPSLLGIESIAVQELPSLDWPIEWLWGILLINDLCGWGHSWAGDPRAIRRPTEQARKQCCTVVSASGPASYFSQR